MAIAQTYPRLPEASALDAWAEGIDALTAAKRVLNDEGTSTPRRQGIRRSLAALLVVQRSMVSERTRLLNQLQSLQATAPVALRERIGEGNGRQLERRLARMRARAGAPAEEQTVLTIMRDLASRSRALAVDARRYERELGGLVRSLDNTLLDEPGSDQCPLQSS